MGRITTNPGDEPRIRGIAVSKVAAMWHAGMTTAEILEALPALERDDVGAAIEFTAREGS